MFGYWLEPNWKIFHMDTSKLLVMTCKFQPLLCAYSIWTGSNLYCARGFFLWSNLKSRLIDQSTCTTRKTYWGPFLNCFPMEVRTSVKQSTIIVINNDSYLNMKIFYWLYTYKSTKSMKKDFISLCIHIFILIWNWVKRVKCFSDMCL